MRAVFLTSCVMVVGCASRPPLACPAASGERVLATKTIVEYPVEGASFAAFVAHARIEPRARLVADESLAIGATEVRFCVDYQPEPFSGGCRVSGLTVGVTARILLPRWTSAPSLTPTSRHRYTLWRDAVAAHEEGHFRIDLRAAQSFHAALSALPPQPDCGLLLGRSGRIVDQLLERTQAEHADWDRSHSDLPTFD